MASTIAFYTGDGATTDFTVPFDYLAKKFVRVSLGVTILKGGDYGDTSKDYYFLDKTKVRLKVPPQEGEVLTIRRYTSATDRVVSFKDASVLKATDLDVSSVQTIHIAEEARDIINDALIKDKEGNWDAKGNRIVNVGDAVSDGDAVNLKLYKEDAKGAYQAKLDAEAARDAAKISETKAKASEVNAKESEVTAKASAGTAVSAAKHVDAVKTENQAILEEARQLQTDIETSESNVYENSVIATQKADEAKVSERNAKVSERNAKESETNAMASEVSASDSASLAKEQVSLATQQATLATTKASEAEDSATSASQSATAAGASAKNASASAGTATTQATNASNSAKAAKLSEDNAALSKTAAGTSETNAKASEVEAKKQADLAKGYAEDAASGQLNADWAVTDSKSKAFIKNKPTLGALASKNSIAYSEITGTPPEQDLSGLATKEELQTGLAGKAPASHAHTVSQITDLTTTLAPYAKTTDVNSKLSDKADTTTVNAGLAKINEVIDIVVGSIPWYQRDSMFTTAKRSVTVPAGTQVTINGKFYVTTTPKTVNLPAVGNGKDVYLYACESSTREPTFVISANSTTPDGYNAQNSRKIGGFHTLCADVGNIEGHSLTGYVAGDIIPYSAWDLKHRPVSEVEGMVWVAPINKWVQIYLPSWSGSKLVSRFNGVIVDGASAHKLNGEGFAYEAGLANCQLISRDEFMIAMRGVPEGFNIQGGKDPNTTGGHVATNGQRIISNYGVEDGAGVIWQWSRDCAEFYPGASWEQQNFYLSRYDWLDKSVYDPNFDPVKRGSCVGLLRRFHLGAFWGDGDGSGSRSVACYLFSSLGWADGSARLVAEPLAIGY